MSISGINRDTIWLDRATIFSFVHSIVANKQTSATISDESETPIFLASPNPAWFYPESSMLYIESYLKKISPYYKILVMPI